MGKAEQPNVKSGLEAPLVKLTGGKPDPLGDSHYGDCYFVSLPG